MTEQPKLPPVKIAFVIDGVVQDVLHTDDRLAAIFLSEPIIIDASDIVTKVGSEEPGRTIVGWTYNGKDFIPPADKE